MKYLKKTLSILIVAAMTVPFCAQAAFAAPDSERGRSPINDALSDSRAGGIMEAAELAAVPAADYGIYYDTESGLRKNNPDGEPLTGDEIPEGMSVDGNVMTLDNVSFVSSAGIALRVGEGVTVRVPENKTAYIMANPEAESEMTCGIGAEGGNTFEVDGALTAGAYGFGGTNNVVGFFSYDDMTITGSGTVTAYSDNGSGYSYGLMSNTKIILDGSVSVSAYAYSPDPRKNNLPFAGAVAVDIEMKGSSALTTSECKNSRGIMIMSGGGITAEDNAELDADGGIVIYGTQESPGAITARDSASINISAKKINFEGLPDEDAAGILGWMYNPETGKYDDGKAEVTASGNAEVTVRGDTAVWGAGAAGGVSVTDGNGASLEYDGYTYVIPGTEDEANYVLFKSAAVDYPLFFDGETSRLYKACDYSFDQETGDVVNATYSDPIEVPGATCDGNKLTLTSDFQFYTDYMDGLYLGNDTTLYVPEGESPTVCGGFSGLVLGAGVGGSSGIFCFGDNTLEIDGNLEVTGCGGTNISSWGIVNSTKNGSLNITGKGSLTARGGDVVYDETLTGSRGDSAGIVSYGDLNISIAEANAIGGDSYSLSAGINVDYPSIEPHAMTISGGSKVTAAAGACTDTEGTFSIGCAANQITVKDKSSLTAMSSDAYDSYGIFLFAWDDYGAGKINLSGGSSIDAAATAVHGCGITARSESNTPIIVNMDNNCTFTAEGSDTASVSELSGVTAVSDGKTVKYDSEKISYIDENGSVVKRLTFRPQSVPSAAHSSSGGSGKPKTTAKPQASASPSPGASAEPQASASSAPNASAAPSASAEPTTAGAPAADGETFINVSPSDWFYDAVISAYTKGLVNGISDTEFGPQMTVTRGMLVTVMGRINGDSPSGGVSFGDVSADKYYAPYVAWAAENGIVTGFDDGTIQARPKRYKRTDCGDTLQIYAV